MFFFYLFLLNSFQAIANHLFTAGLTVVASESTSPTPALPAVTAAVSVVVEAAATVVAVVVTAAVTAATVVTAATAVTEVATKRLDLA
jgi:hypothetical protein